MKTLNVKIEQTGTLTTEKNLGFDDAFAIPVQMTADVPEISDELEKIDVIFDHHGEGWELIDGFKAEPIKLVNVLEKAFGEDAAHEIADELEDEINGFADAVVRKAFEVLEERFQQNEGCKKEIILKAEVKP